MAARSIPKKYRDVLVKLARKFDRSAEQKYSRGKDYTVLIFDDPAAADKFESEAAKLSWVSNPRYIEYGDKTRIVKVDLTLDHVVEKEGPFTVEALPQHKKYIPKMLKELKKVATWYKKQGITLRDVPVQMMGTGSTRSHYQPQIGKITIYPKAFKGAALDGTLAHEIAHFLHDKKLGFRHKLVVDKMREELKRPRERTPSYDGSLMDPKELSEWVQNTSNREALFELQKRAIPTIKQLLRLAKKENNPKFGSLAVAVEKVVITELAARYEELKKGNIKESFLDDWFPVQYSRTNQMEFLAMLVQFHYEGRLPEAPLNWLKTVIYPKFR